MKEYNVSSIREDVRVILDHNKVTPSIEGLESDVNTLDVDEIIDRQIVSAARQVRLVAPREYVQWESMWGSQLSQKATNKSDDHMMVVPLPTDFLRFGSGKLDNWKRAVPHTCTISDTEYEQQWSRFAGVRASNRKPVIAIIEGYSGMEVQMFSCNDDSKVEWLTYAKEPSVSSGKIQYEETLYVSMCYACASLVAEILKDTDKSNQLMSVSKNMMSSIDAYDAKESMQQTNQE